MPGLKNIQSTYKERQQEIIFNIALEAEQRSLLESGLWFHDDVRNNFYYASYLFAAAVDDSFELPFDREQAKQKAQDVLLEILMLQNRQPGTELYGHWPLGLNPVPRDASPHELPVELMGNLLAYFCKRYGGALNAQLRIVLNTAFGHIYRSDFYRKPVVTFGHHEAKYTAAKLIFGTMFADEILLEDGRQSLKDTLAYIRTKGMPEYGSLPWFWHWVQAFTCALELVPPEDTELTTSIKEMLDHLWNVRAEFYLRGAWVGAHSRGWPHDVPGDANVLHDYVQFGDFQLPEMMPRTEYAGLLFYQASDEILAAAMNHQSPVEVRKITQKVVPTDPQPQPLLHSYAYITEEFAAGGMWERVEEFDNEQLRWAFSLPVSGEGGANQLYFFHPGQGYNEGDPRHQSRYMEVLYHKNVIISLFPIPQGEKNTIIGVLPQGEWKQEPNTLYGQVGETYVVIYLSHSYQLQERSRFIEVSVAGMPGGVIVEALGIMKAAECGIIGLEAFAAAMAHKERNFEVGEVLAANYTNMDGESLVLSISRESELPQAQLNGIQISLDHYSV
ncbi:hypothetical protein BSK66_19785 [Paenibacillus odorifer]|uniref:Uncharacterized protein n=1 Tax=Paenibacillus odorifer TaxID=189426 RepID=A0A1R0X773_9BACL|nr:MULTISPECIES: hypothetical protein [Paenibacillus]ETT45840.1 hypothetical protein C171_29409 [Paenibacillus sp. FSL H8-237]OMD30431.1 hypothetical protein BJP51_20460 [Paenibacillus odorifer]OME51616.1 hypothetical protein BSK61_19835 [Paenibacillus odorifer]OME53936.1 hypothetical protein BSK66_19785 [Paenibacillus odorifer]